MVLQADIFVKQVLCVLACPRRQFHTCAVRCNVFPSLLDCLMVEHGCPAISDAFHYCAILFCLLPFGDENLQLWSSAFCFLQPLCEKCWFLIWRNSAKAELCMLCPFMSALPSVPLVLFLSSVWRTFSVNHVTLLVGFFFIFCIRQNPYHLSCSWLPLCPDLWSV